MPIKRLRRKLGAPLSKFTVSVALASTAALGISAVATPAVAKEKKEEKAAKSNYSKEFIAVYNPANELTKAATPDAAALKASVPTVVAAAQTEDDRNAAGSFALTVGNKLSDKALQLQGLELMLASGKTAPEKVGQYTFTAGQLAYGVKDYAKAIANFNRAIELKYGEGEAQAFLAESYFAQNMNTEGLNALTGLITAAQASGKPIKEEWIKRGLAVAYKQGLKDQSSIFARQYVTSYPSETSWGDAVAILLNSGGFQRPEELDLFRLAHRVGALRDRQMYQEYVDAADFRRMPSEVVAIIDEGVRLGKIDSTSSYALDTRKEAVARAAIDARDLSKLAAEANAANAPFTTVMAAADTHLGMGKAAVAEALYTKALASAGVNTPLVLTRLGIAQSDQGKYAEAQATFNKVEGARQAIASLWSVYAGQKMASAPAAQ